MQPEIAETCRLRASIAKMKTKEMHSAEEKNQHKTSEFITWSRLSLERIENFPKQTISYIKGLYTPHYVEIEAYTNKFMVVAKYWVSKSLTTEWDGSFWSRKVTSVITPKVPSLPIIKRARSYLTFNKAEVKKVVKTDSRKMAYICNTDKPSSENIIHS